MQIKNITVCGAGVLGGQIAFQIAFHKFNVTLYDINEKIIKRATTRFKVLGKSYKTDLNATQQEIEQSITRIKGTTNLKEATKNADLIIEAIPEDIGLKKEFYTQLGEVAPAKSIFCTNSSTLLPSALAESTGRPERFLALHFANMIWKRNTAEIMGHETTDQNIFDTVISFAKAIGMITLPIYKEQSGYILNSLLVPFLKSALALYVDEIADPATIDKTWMKATDTSMGPFGICDVIGINTIYNINKIAARTGDKHAQKVAKVLKENFIDQEKLGTHNGKGFYTYPDPAYEQADFME
ncbi:3-hydroxyacyl-CoA dehydrogenase [Aquimarina sp. TRL1]|uniref:3-hydroxyacyl-CoA dehydrogenase n=1 Tax=Aquimarina sp. (strain TRL1) TaxID=2736252 RepID=UPI00158E8E8E|nr:3-hydroxyacyl-CoA dehydrogenase [Aquimarina sp. TRL1]QKX06106.1 3-hydroxyacyl-CoA dehydrogenase [Aquimarina sp. TRL1]